MGAPLRYHVLRAKALETGGPVSPQGPRRPVQLVVLHLFIVFRLPQPTAIFSP